MIFFLNANGVLLKSVPSRVFQGSNKANTIYVVAPIDSNAIASVRFILPNGTYTEQGIMALNTETEIGIADENGKLYYVWTYDVPNIITAEAGQVQCQIVFTNGLQTITSDGIAFTVEKGVPPIEIENISSVDDILAQLGSLGLSLSEKLDRMPNGETPLISSDGKINGSYLPEMSGGGEGTVKSVNDALPDENGNVKLIADNIGAVPSEPIPDQPLIDNNKGKINPTYLPDYILGQMVFGGTFRQDSTKPGDIIISLTNIGGSKLESVGLGNSITNGEILGSSTYPINAEGIYFIASENGITFSEITFETGDWLIATSNGWTKIDNTDAVQSVNGKTGVAWLTAVDVGAVPENQYASQTVAGVVKVNNNNSGLQVQTTQASLGQLRLYTASPTAMDIRTGYKSNNNINYSECAPITVGNLDLAIWNAISGRTGKTVNGVFVETLGQQIPLTDEQKASAKAWLGISGGGTQLYMHEITGSFTADNTQTTYNMPSDDYAKAYIINTSPTPLTSDTAIDEFLSAIAIKITCITTDQSDTGEIFLGLNSGGLYMFQYISVNTLNTEFLVVSSFTITNDEVIAL